MTVLDLTPQMAADAVFIDRWQRSLDARLIVKHDMRPSRRQAALKGHQRRKGMAA